MIGLRDLMHRLRAGRQRVVSLVAIGIISLALPEVAIAASAGSPPASVVPSGGGDGIQWVGRFESRLGRLPPSPWEVVRPNLRVPPTQYGVKEWQGVQAVEAIAHASMALLARPLAIDIARTPVLCWRWRVDAPIASADLTKRSGDDFAARVYVAFRMPKDSMSALTRLKLRIGRSLYGQLTPDASVIYVWDNTHPIGTARRSAYTDRAQVVVLRTGSTDSGRWISERRDVLSDVERAFDASPLAATLLAVATDTDNTGEDAHAGFADLHFVAKDRPCAFRQEAEGRDR